MIGQAHNDAMVVFINLFIHLLVPRDTAVDHIMRGWRTHSTCECRKTSWACFNGPPKTLRMCFTGGEALTKGALRK